MKKEGDKLFADCSLQGGFVVDSGALKKQLSVFGVQLTTERYISSLKVFVLGLGVLKSAKLKTLKSLLLLNYRPMPTVGIVSKGVYKNLVCPA